MPKSTKYIIILCGWWMILQWNYHWEATLTISNTLFLNFLRGTSFPSMSWSMKNYFRYKISNHMHTYLIFLRHNHSFMSLYVRWRQIKTSRRKAPGKHKNSQTSGLSTKKMVSQTISHNTPFILLASSVFLV